MKKEKKFICTACGKDIDPIEWHYRRRLIELGVCTEDEFKKALDVAVG